MIERKDVATLAFALVISALFAASVTKSDLGLPESIVRYLIYSVVTGIILNTAEGRTFIYIAISSVVSASAVLGVLGWIALLNDGIIGSISGARLDFRSNPRFATAVCVGLFVVSAFGVFIGSLARPITLDLLKKTLAMELSEAKRIESLLNVLVKIGGTAALLIFSVVKK